MIAISLEKPHFDLAQFQHPSLKTPLQAKTVTDG
jgi:hypothetical protein